MELLIKWNTKNKEHRTEYMKEWSIKNSVIIHCECGGTYKKTHKSHHLKTKKHNTI
jgi:hypothetical protein